MAFCTSGGDAKPAGLAVRTEGRRGAGILEHALVFVQEERRVYLPASVVWRGAGPVSEFRGQVQRRGRASGSMARDA